MCLNSYSSQNIMASGRRFNIFTILTFSGIFLLLLYYHNVDSESDDGSQDKEDNKRAESLNFEEKLGQRTWRAGNFGDFLEASERARARFLKKRAQRLILPDDDDSLLLWYPGKGAGRPYIWHYYPPDITCPNLMERIGTPMDGGKWVCGLEVFQESGDDCVVYSIGVGGDSSFEQEILQRTNCRIFAFDHTVRKMALAENRKYKDRVTFFKVGLKGTESTGDISKLKSLPELMAENGHDWIDFLKVDIEGAEFEGIFDYFKGENDQLPFGHLNIELHLGKFGDSFSGQRKMFKAFNDLWELLEAKGLRTFSWEDNHYACIGGGKPTLMEYGMINVRNMERNKLIQF